MKKEAPALDALRVASPCTVSWDSMKGDDRVRRCGECRLDVYDLSAMSRREAEALVGGAAGRLCVRFFRRADGTVLTRDCPVGLRAVRRRLARIGAALAAMLLGVLTTGCGSKDPGPTTGTPTTGIAAPPPTMGKPAAGPPVMGDATGPRALQGEVCAPEPPR